MKIYLVGGYFAFDNEKRKDQNRVLVYTQNDVNYDEFEQVLMEKDENEDYQPINQFLDDMFGLYDDDFFFYADIHNENDIEEIKNVLKCSCDYVVESIEEGIF